MSCAAEHAQFNFVSVMAAAALVQRAEGRPADGLPLAMGLAAAALPSLPDCIEPALHPNHRKFFHSVVCASSIAYGMYRLYKWEAESDGEKLARAVLLLGGAAYLGHLALDSLSAKSLPLI